MNVPDANSNANANSNATDNKFFCLNCGKNGHISKKCLFPIISIGIICIRLKADIDLNTIIHLIKKKQNNLPLSFEEKANFETMFQRLQAIDLSNFNECIEYLLIKRKNSLNYVEFIRGKYDINNIDYLEKSINFITTEERKKIQENDFPTLWTDLWGESEIKKNNSEYNDAIYKFNLLKKGFLLKKNEMSIYYSLAKICDNAIYSFMEPEWGFPKGRRNSKEKNIECAKREFEEETNINEKEYDIVNIAPFEETYLASNNLKYKHIYYISQMKDKHSDVYINPKNSSQTIEVGGIEWANFDKAMERFRQYNIEKKNILLNLHLNIKYILEAFLYLGAPTPNAGTRGTPVPPTSSTQMGEFVPMGAPTPTRDPMHKNQMGEFVPMGAPSAGTRSTGVPPMSRTQMGTSDYPY